MSAADVSASARGELKFLRRLLATTAATVDHDTLLRAVIDETREATGTQVSSLYLWNEDSKKLILTATNGLSPSGIGAVRLGIGEGVTGWVAQTRTPLSVPDTRAEPRFTWVPGLDQERYRSMLSVPIVAGDRLVGVINVQTVRQRRFTKDAIAQLEAIGGYVAGIIERSALLDGLTAMHEQRTALLMMLAHDIGTPIAIARSYLHGVQRRVGDDLRAPVSHIDDELTRVENQCRKALDSLRLESASMTLHLREFDAGQLLRSVGRRLRAVSAKGRVRCIVGARRIVAFGDMVAIEEALLNLGENALKYSEDDAPVVLRVVDRKDEVSFVVDDRGSGFAPEVASAFAQPFRRGAAAASAKPGTGLGLYMARRIAEGHGGRLTQAPRTGRGSRVSMDIPKTRSVSPLR